MTRHAAARIRAAQSSVRSGALIASDLTRAYGDRTVLDGVSLTAAPGRRIGLVGDNGSGKSTLLRLLAGVELPDSGTVQRPQNTALLEQELRHEPAATIGDILEASLAELRALAQTVQELGALVQRLPDDVSLAREYGDALEMAQLRQAWDADHRVARVVRGLGIEQFGRAREVRTLSGGERARVAMAALLVRQPQALLLDEPTNHLDDAGSAFLEHHLRGLPGVLVVSSHDRAFLDGVCTDIIDIDPARHGLTRFGGTFTDYLSAKGRERQRWERAYATQQTELRALEQSIDGGAARQVAHGRPARDNDKSVHNYRGDRANRTMTRRVRNAHERIRLLEREPIPRPPQPLTFTAAIGAGLESDEPLIQVRGAAYGGRVAPQSLKLQPEGRLLITGPNGAGKSTLLAMIAGELEPTSGGIEHAEDLRIGYLRQETTFRPDVTARLAYEAAAHGNPSAPAIDDLGLLRVSDLDRPLDQLSEGQRRRVALATLIAQAPHVLLLDEPTNHLAPLLVTQLEEALLHASAAVVVVSHDRWLRARWAGPELRIEA